ncbi:MAG TPA: hypothetical protein PLA34_01875 [Verrucomicrobiota bacterium]|nr:hypothetical protein [Verrucomicrobiota bacterium]
MEQTRPNALAALKANPASPPKPRPRTILIAVVCAALGIGGAVSPAAPARSSAARWQLGAPIITYWAGPGSRTAVNEQAAAQLRAGGWNLAWTQRPEDLDLYHRHGLRVMLEIATPDVEDPAQAQALAALIARVRSHPALYAYYLVDEPGAGAFPKLGRLAAWLRQRDPAHLAYINLLPTYASDGQLQVSDDAAERARVGCPQDFAGLQADDFTALRYREHLRQFVRIVQPDLLSYDHYHFLKSSDGPQYFLNLALIRAAALETGKPFLNIIQTCDSPAEGWRAPGEDEVRWLTYTSLAYGAQGIAHFRYDTGLWRDPNEQTIPLPLYWAVAQLNRQFLAIATELQPLKSLGAYHCGTIPLGGQALPPESAFATEPATAETLLGYFGKSARRPTHVVVVNLNYKNAAPLTLNSPGPLEVFHPPTRAWLRPEGGRRIKLNLPAGGGALVRLRK